MQILGGLEHVAVRQSPVSPPEGRAGRVGGEVGYLHAARLICAFILGLENFTRKGSRGHGGAESRGGMAALRELLAAVSTWTPPQ